MTNTETAAQLDLDKLEANAQRAYLADEHCVAFLQPATVLALIAQARAQPAAARPTDDDLWDATLRDRDAYHDWADKLADAIAAYFGIDIGEHSNQNLPWAEALEAIEAAAPIALSVNSGEWAPKSIEDILRAAGHALRSYQYGNSSPDLAEDVANRIDAQLAAAPAAPHAQAEPVADEACGACYGTGWVVRDSDIGTDQECFVCEGVGSIAAPAPQEAEQASASPAGVESLTLEQFEPIAQSWDGCDYDGIDIGASLRHDFKLHSPTTTKG